MSSFDAFRAAFKGDIVTPSDGDYEQAIARWAANAARRAKIVAFVKSPEDVSLAIRFAKAEGLPIAIRGGAHNVAGASSAEDGLVIDLSRHLNGVRVDPEKKLGYVGGGAIWETVDKTAIQYGLATVGGTVNHTGVAGLTLGGGYGWLSGQHGLALDNLVQATMVVGDGRVLTANSEDNPDLFWAIRGAGSNFGVCTEFVFQLHDQRRTVYGGILFHPGSQIQEVAAVTNQWLKTRSQDEALLQAVTKSPHPDFKPTVANIVFYNGSEEEGRKHFKAFLDLNPIDTTAEIPYEKLNSLQNEMVGYGRCTYMRGIKYESLQPEELQVVFDKIMHLSGEELAVTTIFEHFALDKSTVVSNDATAMNNRSSQASVLTHCMWANNTPENLKAGKENVDIIADLVSSKQPDFYASKYRAYANYTGDILTSSRSQILFGSNYPRLQELKKKYDPDCLFMKWFPIQPAA